MPWVTDSQLPRGTLKLQLRALAGSGQGVSVDRRLSIGGAPGEQIEQEAMWFFVLTFGGFQGAP
jgi:hypothetical protein